MKTKYIKVSTADRLPDKQGKYLCKIKDRTLYCKQIFWNQKDFIEEWQDGIEYWLDENPDYEEEMREMLEELNNSIDEQNTSIGISSDLNDAWEKIQKLLTKIKES